MRLCRCAFIASKINWGLTQTNQTWLTQFSGLFAFPKFVQDWVSPQNQNLRVNLDQDGQIHYCTLGIHYIRTKICFSGFIHNKLIHVAWNLSFFVLIGRQRISPLDFRGTIRHPHIKKDTYLGGFFTVIELESLFLFGNYRGFFFFFAQVEIVIFGFETNKNEKLQCKFRFKLSPTFKNFRMRSLISIQSDGG